jgi:hypothetical protein
MIIFGAGKYREEPDMIIFDVLIDGLRVAPLIGTGTISNMLDK